MGEIKAIETEYKNHKFRSRLEARWAVFFDALGIKWEYEKEGYDLDGIYYLPDFWLPELNVWIEIKADKPTEEEDEKAFRLSFATGKQVIILFGGRMTNDDSGGSGYLYFAGDDGRGWDCSYQFCECPDCGAIGIQFDGRSDRLACKNKQLNPCPKHSANGDKTYTNDTPRILNALKKAQSARFEHGENPDDTKPKKKFIHGMK